MMLRDKGVAVFGATSGIARVICREMASRGARLHLCARDSDEVQRIAGDLSLRYRVPVGWSEFDAVAYARHAHDLDRAAGGLGGLDGVVIAFGIHGEQEEAQRDFGHALDIVSANYLGALSLLTHAANHLEARGGGFVLALTSVAGERGRKRNYVYGSAKAGLSNFLQGLRHRLAPAGVLVVDARPGPVDTKMTFGREGVPLLASPDDVGRAIVRGLEAGRETIYAPWFWRAIMLVIRNLPEPIFKRLDL